MTKFKKGDRVRPLQSHHLSAFETGEGVVQGYDEGGGLVVLPDGKSIYSKGCAASKFPVGSGTFSGEHFELVKPASKFRVGDRVTFALTSRDTYQVVPAPEGEPGGIYDHRIQNDRTGHSCWAFEHELTPVQYAPGFTLRRGDRIVNTKTGRKGHVVEGQDEELWVVDHTYCEETGAPAKAVEEYEHHYPNTYEITNRKEGGPF